MSLNDLPAEVIVKILWATVDYGRLVCSLGHEGVTASTIVQLNRMATVSKHIYGCYKDSEFAVFRKAVRLILQAGTVEGSSNKGQMFGVRGPLNGIAVPWIFLDHSTVPGLPDLVIKIGSLMVMPNRPTDPDEIKAILEAVQRDYQRSLTREQFDPEVPVELHHSKDYDAVLTWLANRYSQQRIKEDAMSHFGHDVNGRGHRVPPYSAQRHPFEVLYPPSAFYNDHGAFFCDGRNGTRIEKNQRAEYYLTYLFRQVEKWRGHLAIPWTIAEASYRLSVPAPLPCCLARDCPRGPNYQPRVAPGNQS